jgi:hypothetical protein
LPDSFRSRGRGDHRAGARHHGSAGAVQVVEVVIVTQQHRIDVPDRVGGNGRT